MRVVSLVGVFLFWIVAVTTTTATNAVEESAKIALVAQKQHRQLFDLWSLFFSCT